MLGCLATVLVPVTYHVFGYALEDDAKWVLLREAEEYTDLMSRLSSAKSELAQLNVPEGLRQAELLTDIIQDYHAVVETRFVGKKHSPLAYIGAARTVQKHALQNLVDVIAVTHSMSSIARNRLDSSLIDNDEERQRDDKHLDMYEGQEERTETLLQENRNLFDALTETAVEVANIQTFSKFDRIDTLARLVGLAEIANRTGK